jgi:hypothetical protein
MVVGACGLGANPSARTSEPSPASTAGYLTYSDATYGFRIQYPRDWSEQAGAAGSVVAFVSQPSGQSGGFRDNVNVLVQDLADPSTSLQQYTDLSIRQAPDLIDGFKLVSSGPDVLAGRSAERVTYLGQSGNHDLKFEAIWLVERGRAYVITFTATRDTFDAVAPMAEAMIDSFRLG